MEIPEQLQGEVTGGNQVLAPQQKHGLSPVRPAAKLVAAGVAKGVVQLGEERAGTGKVQNINTKY